MRFPLLCFFFAALVPLAVGEKCSLCPTDEGISKSSSIIPQLEIPGDPNPNCQDALDYALTVDAEDEICSLLKSQASYCGCANVDPPAEPCLLCSSSDSSIRNDLRTGAGDTCKELAAYLSFLSAEECQTERGQTLLRNAFACGCEGATTECAICPDGTITMENPDNVVPFFSLVDGIGNPTCQELAVLASSAAPGTINCDLIQKQAGFCGCANTEPINECSFCPGGETPANQELVVATTDTCLELFEYMTYMDADSCATGRAADIQAMGYVCGCPGVEPQCSLCPNGDDPPEPDRVPVDGGPSCAQLAQNAAGLTEALCADQRDTILGIQAARCGCEGADYPSCSFSQNPNLCTEELLASVPDVDCECYSFCDFEFAQCHAYPGGLLLGEQCAGTPIAGCNRATALLNKDGSPTATSSASTISSIFLWVLVALFVTWS